MISTAMSKAEAREEYPGATANDLPKYPYGMSITLDDLLISKLGISDVIPVGTAMNMMARVTVTRVGQREAQNGDPETTMELQITDMEIENPATKTANVIYGKGGGSNAKKPTEGGGKPTTERLGSIFKADRNLSADL